MFWPLFVTYSGWIYSGIHGWNRSGNQAGFDQFYGLIQSDILTAFRHALSPVYRPKSVKYYGQIQSGITTRFCPLSDHLKSSLLSGIIQEFITASVRLNGRFQLPKVRFTGQIEKWIQAGISQIFLTPKVRYFCRIQSG